MLRVSVCLPACVCVCLYVFDNIFHSWYCCLASREINKKLRYASAQNTFYTLLFFVRFFWINTRALSLLSVATPLRGKRGISPGIARKDLLLLLLCFFNQKGSRFQVRCAKQGTHFQLLFAHPVWASFLPAGHFYFGGIFDRFEWSYQT